MKKALVLLVVIVAILALGGVASADVGGIIIVHSVKSPR